MTKIAIAALVLAASTAAAQNVLFDNGGFITHPGQGANGADASQVDTSFFGLGNVVAWTSPGDIYRGAEDFVILSGQSWTVDRIRVFVYNQVAAGQFPPPPAPFTALNMKIWDGDPRQPTSQVVATSDVLGEREWANSYRVDHGNLTQDTRPIYRVDAVFNQEQLGEGTYWIDYQIVGGFAVTPYVKDGLLNAHGNAMVLFSTAVGWAQTTYSGRGVAYPFQVLGAGPSGCYANCDGSTTPPILNVEDFTCFINEFAAAQALPHEQQIIHYANCDQSTTAPVLNVEDFTCFINKFAAGCP
jgi:hypothetical protein